jgi:hypothetical protein
MKFMVRFPPSTLRWSTAGVLTMGIFTARAQQVITPQSIDGYLSGLHVQDSHHNSVTPALAGQGAEFVKYGGQYGVDPRFIVAISGAESSFGVRICTANNAWNWFWEGPCPKSPFDSLDSGVHTVSHFMHSSYIIRGYNTIELIGARYCVTGCEHWVPGVTAFYQQMGADKNILTWIPPAVGPPAPTTRVSAAAGPPAPATPMPAAPAPETVTLKSVTLAKGNWRETTRSVTVTAVVSGSSLIPGTVYLWQEVAAGHVRKRLAQLSQLPGSTEQPYLFTGTAILTGAAAADLYVAAAFKHRKTQVVRASTAMPEPAQPRPPLWIYILLAALTVLTFAGALLAFSALRRRIKRPGEAFPAA